MKTDMLLAIAGTAVLVLVGYAASALSARDEPQAAREVRNSNLFPFLRTLEDRAAVEQPRAPAGDVSIVYAQLRNLFDYYLDGAPQKPVAQLAADIDAELGRKNLALPAGETGRLLEQYVHYRRDAAEIEKAANAAGTLEAARNRLSSLQQARTHYFNAAEIQGIFSMDDALDKDVLARLEVMQDRTLDAQQQQQKLAALDAALSPTEKAAREARFGFVKFDDVAQDDPARSQAAPEGAR